MRAFSHSLPAFTEATSSPMLTTRREHKGEDEDDEREEELTVVYEKLKSVKLG
jgi:hypothetical protein